MDILVKQGTTTLTHSTDYDLEHDTSTLKTTITLTGSAPSEGTIITVERLNDKYLRFKDIT